jgi:hypothetical protein
MTSAARNAGSRAWSSAWPLPPPSAYVLAVDLVLPSFGVLPPVCKCGVAGETDQSWGERSRPSAENGEMNEAALRRELVRLLEGRGAHMSFEDAVADFPDDAINRRPPNVGYTPWHLIEHLRLVQLDLLEYLTEADYGEKPWPDAVWPAPDAVATREEFDRSLEEFLADRGRLRAIIEDPSTDLFATVPSSSSHTILREIRLAADHCAYHVGEFAVLRQVMGTWPPSRDER